MECPAHGDAPPETCGRCGDFMCPGCAVAYREGRYCKACVEAVVLEREPAWESALYKFGTFRAYTKTASACLFDSRAFYKKVPPDGGPGKAVGYFVFGAMMFGTPLALVAFVAAVIMFHSLIPSWVDPAFIPQLFLYGIPAAIAAFIGVAGIYHLLARVLGARRKFEGTLRILSYAWGSLWLLQIVPGIGLVPAFFFAFLVPFRGFQEVQGLSAPRALVCALWPLAAAGALAAIL
jgi:hypothetical protein